MKRVSFVIPSFNAAAWLPLAVKSALDQTHKDVEVVVVDDCSTDSTPDYLSWLEAQADPRIRVLRNEKNIGRSASRNIGNAAASGDVICVLDADDLATPGRAAATLAKMERTKAQFVFGGAKVIDAVGKSLGEVLPEPFILTKADKSLLNGIIHSGAAYTKDLATRFPYPEDADLSALGLDDWAHQRTIAEAGIELTVMATVVCAYRTLSSGISNTRDPDKVKAAKLALLGMVPAGAS